mmetsp:Transcript_13693/g.34941  ORF Transcript_13693/g.34941 Transcript_13693/m.34941 type:complete len:351 (+) Transcript_13693:2061-3113(+)
MRGVNDSATKPRLNHLQRFVQRPHNTHGQTVLFLPKRTEAGAQNSGEHVKPLANKIHCGGPLTCLHVKKATRWEKSCYISNMHSDLHVAVWKPLDRHCVVNILAAGRVDGEQPCVPHVPASRHVLLWDDVGGGGRWERRQSAQHAAREGCVLDLIFHQNTLQFCGWVAYGPDRVHVVSVWITAVAVPPVDAHRNAAVPQHVGRGCHDCDLGDADVQGNRDLPLGSSSSLVLLLLKCRCKHAPCLGCNPNNPTCFSVLHLILSRQLHVHSIPMYRAVTVELCRDPYRVTALAVSNSDNSLGAVVAIHMQCAVINNAGLGAGLQVFQRLVLGIQAGVARLSRVSSAMGRNIP